MSDKIPKGHRILKAKDSKKYPEFNPLSYDESLAKNLTYYNNEIGSRLKKTWTIDYFVNEGYDTKGFKQLNDTYYSTSGAIAHMVSRGIILEERHLIHLSKKYDELKSLVDDKKLPTADNIVVKKNPSDTKKLDIQRHISEIEGAIDFFMENGYDSSIVDVKSYLISNDVKSSVASKVGTWFKPLLKELTEAYNGSDNQLVESYSHMQRNKLKKLLTFVKIAIDSCDMAAATGKAVRMKKVKSPSQLVKKVKYMISLPELGIRSQKPEKLIGAGEVWLYSVKLRRLYKYVALSSEGISVKGMTLINIDPEKSGGKIIRKPETQMKGVSDMTTRPLNKLFNGINATQSKAIGRMNSDTIILKCFK